MRIPSGVPIYGRTLKQELKVWKRVSRNWSGNASIWHQSRPAQPRMTKVHRHPQNAPSPDLPFPLCKVRPIGCRASCLAAGLHFWLTPRKPNGSDPLRRVFRRTRYCRGPRPHSATKKSLSWIGTPNWCLELAHGRMFFFSPGIFCTSSASIFLRLGNHLGWNTGIREANRLWSLGTRGFSLWDFVGGTSIGWYTPEWFPWAGSWCGVPVGHEWSIFLSPLPRLFLSFFS